MDWSNDDSLQLIEQYRLHTELWDRSDPKYKDKMCRFRGWSEIADSFGCTKAEVERKMNVLLTQYRREKHKMMMKRYEGMQPGTSKWYAFKNFGFLENVTSQAHLMGSCGMLPKPRKRKNMSGPSNGDNIFAGVSLLHSYCSSCLLCDIVSARGGREDRGDCHGEAGFFSGAFCFVINLSHFGSA